MSDRFRCCICTHINERSFTKHEQLAGLSKRKTLKTHCEECGADTVQNKLGA